ncbi:MAG: GntR family transcriptional regulator [Lachnospiraceae bacterium]|jgi:DNA-binding GntR family transcriptional regulator|nr:GntR family transcriptional regulator [Lachnospiraceae bacterium]
MQEDLIIDRQKEKESNRDYAYYVMRKNIMVFRLPPGTPINEGEWANLLDMSRTPVHEAVNSLKDEFLLDVIPQSGTRVSKINVQVVREGNELRKLVETDLIQKCAGHISGEYLQKMKAILDEQKKLSEQDEDYEKDLFLRLDDKFHRLLYEAAGKERTWRCVKGLCTHYDRVRYAETVLNHTQLSRFYEEHQAIYQMVMMGLPPNFDIESFYDVHLGYYRVHFAQVMEKFPDYFTI